MKTKLLFAAIALVASQQSLAADSPWSVSAGSKQHTLSEGPLDLDIRTLDFGAAYRFNDNFSVEGRFGFGVTDELVTESVEYTQIEFSINRSASVLAKAEYPTANFGSVYAVAGVDQTVYNAKLLNTEFKGSDHFSEAGLVYGVGYAFNLNSKAAFTVEYLKLPAADFDSDLGLSSSAIGIGFSFKL
jgi:opacity protein-like surface antigen